MSKPNKIDWAIVCLLLGAGLLICMIAALVKMGTR